MWTTIESAINKNKRQQPPKQCQSKKATENICKHRLIVMWDYWRVGCSLARSDDLGAYVIGTHFSSIWLRLFGVVTVCRFACTIFYGKLSMVQSLVAMALNAMKRMNNARLWRCSHLWNKQFCLFHSSLSECATKKTQIEREEKIGSFLSHFTHPVFSRWISKTTMPHNRLISHNKYLAASSHSLLPFFLNSKWSHDQLT